MLLWPSTSPEGLRPHTPEVLRLPTGTPEGTGAAHSRYHLTPASLEAGQGTPGTSWGLIELIASRIPISTQLILEFL